MLVRTLIISTYILATLLSPAQASVCDEMAANDMYLSMNGNVIANVSSQRHSVSDSDSLSNNHKSNHRSNLGSNQPPCASNMGTGMTISVNSNTSSNTSMDKCNDMCATVCAPSGINISGTTQLLTTIDLSESIILQVAPNQVLAAQKTRQLRPPIS